MNHDTSLYVYVCGVDWQHEMDVMPTKVYPSIESLKKNSACWEECGIVRLRVELDEWVVEQNLFHKEDDCA